MAATNRPSRKELVALGTAVTFSYVGLFASFFLTGQYAMQMTGFEVFLWIIGGWWLLNLVLSAWFGDRLAKRQRWDGVVGVTLGVMPWLVITVLALLYV